MRPPLCARDVVLDGTVQAGDYPESNQTVTEHVSADGRFTILPTGSRRWLRGGKQWVWRGYDVTDHHPELLPKWHGRGGGHPTVRDCKRWAERRIEYMAKHGPRNTQQNS